MNNKIISFCVAAYNAENTIAKCLQSFLIPSILSKIEIIVVNDGSTDNTKYIVSQYEKKYPDTIKLISQQNKGHGGALNTAIINSVAKYIKPIDSDDWIKTDNLIRYVSFLEHCESDVVISDYDRVTINTNRKIKFSVKCKYEQRYIDMLKLMKVFDKISPCCTFHGITYKTSLYKRLGIKLTEKIFYEDNEYAIMPFIGVNSVYLLPLSIYQYSIGNPNQSVSFKNQVKKINDIETVIFNILKFRNKKQNLINNPQDSYIMSKLSIVLTSYYVVSLIKHPNKKLGRDMAKKMKNKIQNIAPKLNRIIIKKYYILILFNYIRLSPYLYQKLIDSFFYKKIRTLFV